MPLGKVLRWGESGRNCYGTEVGVVKDTLTVLILFRDLNSKGMCVSMSEKRIT
jgi:hypothetical protein